MPSLDFLAGQSPWLILAIFGIGGLAYVLRGQIKRTGDTGRGKEGLSEADDRADFLFEKAMESAAEVERLRNALRACEDTLTEAGIRTRRTPEVDTRGDEQ